MSHLILLLIMLGSLGGIVFMLWRKLPLLLEMSSSEETDLKTSMRLKVKDAVQSQSARSAKLFDRTMLKTRGFRAKAGSHTGDLVEKLRRKSEARKGEFEESYWEKLRKKTRRK